MVAVCSVARYCTSIVPLIARIVILAGLRLHALTGARVSPRSIPTITHSSLISAASDYETIIIARMHLCCALKMLINAV